MVVLNEMADLGGDLGAIPSHNQHLTNCPRDPGQIAPMLAAMISAIRERGKQVDRYK